MPDDFTHQGESAGAYWVNWPTVSAHVPTGVCTTEYHSTTEYQFFISLIKFEGNMLYTLFFVNIYYSSFSLNGHIKMKNGYFHKILKNNRDKQEI
jgi:hypothetical protein